MQCKKSFCRSIKIRIITILFPSQREPQFSKQKDIIEGGFFFQSHYNENQDLLVLYIKLTNSENDNIVLRNHLLYFATIPFQRSIF